MADRIAEMRTRLQLPTPCPECSDKERSTYCVQCVRALASVLGISESMARSMYGRKRAAQELPVAQGPL